MTKLKLYENNRHSHTVLQDLMQSDGDDSQLFKLPKH